MKKGQLTQLGLSEELAQKVADASAEEMKGFIPKTRFDEVNYCRKDLESQIIDRDKQLKELQEKVKGKEELEKIIKSLQDENKRVKEQFETKIRDLVITSEIQAKLSGAKYADLLVTKFDKTKLTVAENGSVVGLNEQFNTIKETYKDLFVTVVKGKAPYNYGYWKGNLRKRWKG